MSIVSNQGFDKGEISTSHFDDNKCFDYYWLLIIITITINIKWIHRTAGSTDTGHRTPEHTAHTLWWAIGYDHCDHLKSEMIDDRSLSSY